MAAKIIEHYLDFIEKFFSIPSEYKTLEEITNTPEFKSGEPIINEIKPIFIDEILRQIKTNGINFNFLKYNYPLTINFKGIHNIFDFYNNPTYMKDFCIYKLDFAKKYNKITEERLLHFTTLLNHDSSNIYDIIHMIRLENMWLNNSLFSSFMQQDSAFKELSTKYNDRPNDFDIILIGGESHSRILLKNNIRKQIILFDPSYTPSIINKYTMFLDLFGHDYTHIILDLDIQNVESKFQDLFCTYWCFHFIYFNLLLKVNHNDYIEFFRKTSLGTQSYFFEIKIFILKIIRNLPIFKKHMDVYWKKYLKYKQKYLELKNNI
jgi:hypothetical protein